MIFGKTFGQGLETQLKGALIEAIISQVPGGSAYMQMLNVLQLTSWLGRAASIAGFGTRDEMHLASQYIARSMVDFVIEELVLESIVGGIGSGAIRLTVGRPRSSYQRMQDEVNQQTLIGQFRSWIRRIIQRILPGNFSASVTGSGQNQGTGGAQDLSSVDSGQQQEAQQPSPQQQEAQQPSPQQQEAQQPSPQQQEEQQPSPQQQEEQQQPQPEQQEEQQQPQPEQQEEQQQPQPERQGSRSIPAAHQNLPERLSPAMLEHPFIGELPPTRQLVPVVPQPVSLDVAGSSDSSVEPANTATSEASEIETTSHNPDEDVEVRGRNRRRPNRWTDHIAPAAVAAIMGLTSEVEETLRNIYNPGSFEVLVSTEDADTAETDSGADFYLNEERVDRHGNRWVPNGRNRWRLNLSIEGHRYISRVLRINLKNYLSMDPHPNPQSSERESH